MRGGNQSLSLRFGPGYVRLLLAFLVVAYHYTPLRTGPFAVACFFVLSGYWITRMWTTTYQHYPHPKALFLLSRWLRMAPMLAICTTAALLVSQPTAKPTAGWLIRQAVIAGGTGTFVPLAPAWSLDVEMQLYIAFICVAPWILARGVKTNRAGLLACVWGVATILYSFLQGDIIKPWFWIWMPAFLAGAWIYTSNYRATTAHLCVSSILIFIAITVVICAPQLHGYLWHQKSSDAHVPWLGSYHSTADLLMTACILPWLASNLTVTDTKAATFAGRLSFPLYLWHWIPHNILAIETQRTGFSRWETTTVAIVASLAGAIFLTGCVDSKCEQFRRYWIKRLSNTSI